MRPQSTTSWNNPCPTDACSDARKILHAGCHSSSSTATRPRGSPSALRAHLELQPRTASEPRASRAFRKCDETTFRLAVYLLTRTGSAAAFPVTSLMTKSQTLGDTTRKRRDAWDSQQYVEGALTISLRTNQRRPHMFSGWGLELGQLLPAFSRNPQRKMRLRPSEIRLGHQGSDHRLHFLI